jgi:hypothetical protein
MDIIFWNFTKKILNYLIFLKFYQNFYQNFILPKLSQKLPNFTKSKLIYQIWSHWPWFSTKNILISLTYLNIIMSIKITLIT